MNDEKYQNAKIKIEKKTQSIVYSLSRLDDGSLTTRN